MASDFQSTSAKFILLQSPGARNSNQKGYKRDPFRSSYLIVWHGLFQSPGSPALDSREAIRAKLLFNMHFGHINLANAVASLTAIFQTRRAIGTASITNSCSFPIYLSRAHDTVVPIVALDYGQTYVEPYSTQADIVVSKDLATSPLQSVTNFKYRVDMSSGQIFYDISHVNGDAFAGNSVSLVPSDANCPSIATGDGGWSTTKVCAESADLQLTFCGYSRLQKCRDFLGEFSVFCRQ